jgi:hypothetical protein
MIFKNEKKNCMSENKGRALDAVSSGFLAKCLSGELCGKAFVGNRVRKTKPADILELIDAELPSFVAEPVLMPVIQEKEGIKGLPFMGLYILTGLAVVAMIRARSVVEDKEA